MKVKIRHTLPFLLSMGCIVILVVVFWSFFMNNIVQPIMLIFWAVWRIILSVNQKIYWGALLAICFYLAIRMIPTDFPHPQHESEDHHSQAQNGYPSWLILLTSIMSDISVLENLNKKIIDLYISVMAQRYKITSEDADKLTRSKNTSFPEKSQFFLFPDKGTLKYKFFRLKLRIVILLTTVINKWRLWMPAMIHEPIDEVLSLMENFEERRNE